MASTILRLPFFITLLSLHLHTILSQPNNTSCNGVFLSYTHTVGYPIPPTDQANQPYRFESSVTLLNNGLDELKSWRVSIGFQHREMLVSLTNAVLADGTSLPANVGNDTVLTGFPQTDLKSAVETAGDRNQMEARVQLVGTQFGVGAPNVPLPASFGLANDGYSCSAPTTQGNNQMLVCCIKDLNSQPSNTTDDEFLSPQDGDLVIMYDVIRSYESNYWAQVSISNHNPFGRLDNWKLSWDWMREEFIYSMRGAYPSALEVSECVFGSQGQHYRDLDFSEVLTCARRPTIIDLPPTKANDTDLGRIPFCCRDGMILPPSVDPNKAMSVFQMQVYKMPPDLNRTELKPPQNWMINGTMGSNYQCGAPIRVSPTQFPDPNGVASGSSAIASWQVICNITRSIPRCCVSFSAFYNDSAVPCSTCACGCNSVSQTCSANEPALLLRPKDLIVPFENRTEVALAWARLKGRSVPNPLPCGDNCGVSINWHLLEDYRGGWQVRMSLFRWGETDVMDWFAAVQLEKAGAGLERVYSFNASFLPGSNNTIVMQGLPGQNYLLAQTDDYFKTRDPQVPRSQQSVILFSKKMTPDIDVAGGDGFPSKVIFNGEECALPAIFPSDGWRVTAAFIRTIVLPLVLTLISMI
ncbi:COBRA protein-7 precursor [Tripterygium wilfordii]|uniref:COBRA protein-7 n=1 Tax=Tripterygium wilfordii TaxID=458696 RepID=A0A7J7DI28_TRIWF|nr:COBRA protein-7 precursor [Tripterygium wilfordii]